MRLLNLFILFVVVLVGGAAATWMVKVPQPMRHDVKLAYARDFTVYQYKKRTDPAMDPHALANAGNLFAKLAAGEELFRQGTTDKKYYEQALPYLQAAADYGLPEAQNALGVARQNGLGVATDDIAAYKWFKLATDAGDKLAEDNLLALARHLKTPQIDAGIAAEKTWLAEYRDKTFELGLLPSGL